MYFVIGGMHLPWIIFVIKDGAVLMIHLPVFELILWITIVYIYTADGLTRPGSRRINPLIKEFLSIGDFLNPRGWGFPSLTLGFQVTGWETHSF